MSPRPRLRKSVVLPAILLVYLAVMCYIGRGELRAGHYAYYFTIAGLSLLCIVGLFFTLRRRERRRAEGRPERPLHRHNQ